MPSPICERAVIEALQHGNALLKFISPNDVGITGSHQCGFYLPKSAWEMFTPYPPVKGRKDKHDVSITWQDGRITGSVVTWYGKKTRSEYRLTRFGRDFPWLAEDSVGDLLVLIAKNQDDFNAYVLDLQDDIDEIQAALGVEPFEHWGIFHHGTPIVETEDECLDREFRRFVEPLTHFPTGAAFSEKTRRVLQGCFPDFPTMSADDGLITCYRNEYQLFRLAERQICQREVTRLFRNVDDFLKVAGSIMNRRKSRAGRSLENHMDYYLSGACIPHDMRPPIDGKPDIVIPSTDAYLDKNFPAERLFVVGVKTTCKDRWRQVLNEGKRVPRKYLFTIQPSISTNQLREMHKSGVRLIVPQSLHRQYRPPKSMRVLNMQGFINLIRRSLR